MVYFIEETFEVNINDVFVTFVNVLLRLLYALVCVFVGTETIAVGFKLELEYRCDGLCNGLLQPSVCYGRNTKQTGFAVAFRNVNS